MRPREQLPFPKRARATAEPTGRVDGTTERLLVDDNRRAAASALFFPPSALIRHRTDRWIQQSGAKLALVERARNKLFEPKWLRVIMITDNT